MSADEYVPDEEAMEVAWIESEASAEDINVASAEFDRFLARVRRDAAKTAWDEGCAAAEQYYKRTAIGVPGSDPIPAPLNPYRETGDRRQR